MAREQVYGGKEADEVRSAAALMQEHRLDTECTEREWDKAMREAFALGPGYGHNQCVELRNHMIACGWSQEKADAALRRAMLGIKVEGITAMRRIPDDLKAA